MMGPSTVAVIAAALVSAVVVETDAPSAARNANSASTATTIATTDAVRGRVSGVSVLPGVTGAEIVIAVDPAVALSHFTLAGPHRVVVDLGGASIALRTRNYDGITRGPVRNVRLSQFRVDTVRLVIDLDDAHQYEVVRSGNELRLALKAPAAQFARWDMSPAGSSAIVASSAPVAPLAKAPIATQEAAGKLGNETQSAEVARSNAANTTSETRSPEPAKVETPKAEQAQRIVPNTVDSVIAQKMSDNAQSANLPNSSREGFRDQPNVVTVPTANAATTLRRLQQQKPRITVNFDGTDIRDVIATFASFSGRSIIVGKDVSGTITADINDKPWDIALQAILQGQGLSATEDASGILTVDSYRNLASNQALEPLVTQIIDVNYAKAAALEQTVQKLLARDCTGLTTAATGREMGVQMNQQQGNNQNQGMSGSGCVVRGSVASDSATNKLIITEVPSRLPEIVQRLAQLDIRTQQVAIKAKIIFVNRTGIQDIGLAYDLGKGNEHFFQQLVPRNDPTTLKPVDTNGDGVNDALGGGTPFQGPARISLGGNALAGIANANNAIKPNALNLIYSTALGRYQLTAFLNALTTSSLADVQSEPSVTILNNRTATIFVGQEIPIRVIDASAGGQGGGGGGGGGGAGGQPNAAAFFPRATVSKEEAGIKLTVTPQITNNRMVLLNIQAENSSAEIANTDVGVVFNRQRAESQVLVADGEAAVIGGLTVTETNKFRSGIPVLMNLPFIGKIFSQNTTNETKRDLLILVTPHILEDGAAPPPGR